MSTSPLPIHMGCYGVSSDAVNLARGYQRNSYADRLATVKSTMSAPVALESGPIAPVSISSAAGGQNGSRPAPEASPARQTPQVRLQPLGTDQAHQILTSGGGSGGNSSGGSGGGSCSSPNSMRFRAHTKHVKTVAPTLQALDFISIAVNSVGGGGVPRPYGKFQACRSGDGNATWERLPPPPGSWQARALPIAVTLLGDSPPPAGPPRSAASSRSRATGRQEGYVSPSESAATSPRRGQPQAHAVMADGAVGHVSRVGGDATRLRLSYSPQQSSRGLDLAGGGGAGAAPAYGRGRSRSQPSPGGGAAASRALKHPVGAVGGGTAATPTAGAGPGGDGRSSQEPAGYYRRPGSSVHRSLVPLPPPEPYNLGAWFALPAATFLADVPNVPEHLRMDNGYSVSRQFLMSGLNPPRRPPQPSSPPRSPTSAPTLLPPGGPPQQSLQQQQQQPEGSGQALSHSQPLLPTLTGDGLHLQPHHSHQQQPELLRPEESLALWNALESAAAAASAAAAQQQQHYGVAIAPGRLRGVYVPLEKRPTEPSALAVESAPGLLASLGSPAGGVGAPALRGPLHLPPEVTLPRRAEPAGW